MAGFRLRTGSGDAGSRSEIDADDVVGFELVGYRAVAEARDHGCQGVALLDEIFRADRVVETLAEGDVAELDAVKAWM